MVAEGAFLGVRWGMLGRRAEGGAKVRGGRCWARIQFQKEGKLLVTPLKVTCPSLLPQPSPGPGLRAVCLFHPEPSLRSCLCQHEPGALQYSGPGALHHACHVARCGHQRQGWGGLHPGESFLVGDFSLPSLFPFSQVQHLMPLEPPPPVAPPIMAHFR